VPRAYDNSKPALSGRICLIICKVDLAKLRLQKERKAYDGQNEEKGIAKRVLMDKQNIK
jgi:hypothetical protein